MSYKCISRLMPSVRNVRALATRQTPLARSFFGRGTDPFTEAFRQMERVRREMDKLMDGVFKDSSALIPRSLFGRIKDIPVESSTNGETYTCKVNLEGYAPEDIEVTLVNNNVTVKAKKHTKSSDGSQSYRESVYHYTLPENVNVEALRSRLSENGELVLEAPLLKIEAPKSKEIPIERKESSDKN
ncbi:heat shock protein beta-11-like protein [Dinothrombium tinctorium]|uniref:Heat shock protein beta-11-like protein n=1 Tax=Dinothrombium tinctorium TaxID=1965070 RepID=A0A443REU9_9ACAR|nr:heat shock protein beta-11-like protein [Dinothrombium tinctorium]RWS13779.1 heat shock protein beta-11-like protein [Dinothrombium tinctorium]